MCGCAFAHKSHKNNAKGALQQFSFIPSTKKMSHVKEASGKKEEKSEGDERDKQDP